MTLVLSVPSLSARNPGDMELQPPKVKKWIEDLPLLNIAETSRKLFSTLSIHNRVEFDDLLRLQLLELFRYPLNGISIELAKQYIGQPLPLSEKHKTVAEQNRQLQLEMASGYKRLVLNRADKAGGDGKELTVTALMIQRAIRCLTDVLAVSYQTYSPYPPETWKEIHALHAHAEELKLIETEIDDPLNKALPRSSVNHAYKQALLLDFSDPYHLPPRMVDRIHHYLDRWASLAQLSDVTPAYNPTCQFLIDQEKDRAGIVYSADAVLNKHMPHYRLLNTVELARLAHTQLTLLKNGQLPPSEGLRENFFQEGGQDLLKRIISAWGVNPQRSFRRSHRDGHQVDIAVGLDAVNYWINGGKKFIVSSNFVGPMPQRTQLGVDDKKPPVARMAEREYSTWDVADESAGGLSLSKNGQIRVPVYVGDLVITRPPGIGSAWSVGVIRWVRSAGSSSVEIGIQHLAPGAEPTVIKTVSEKKIESDFLPALLLPEIKPLKQPQTLIVQRGICKPGVEIFMDNGYRLYRIAPAKLIEASHSFEQFSFEMMNA
ncbi:MAG: hypothetical protein HY274_10840 [Gammaproteobacteria bacterium]|nr:hypothetical protein [Gammaproteobacteria bacterium]